VYFCVRAIDFGSFYNFSIGYLKLATVWYFFSFYILFESGNLTEIPLTDEYDNASSSTVQKISAGTSYLLDLMLYGGTIYILRYGEHFYILHYGEHFFFILRYGEHFYILRYGEISTSLLIMEKISTSYVMEKNFKSYFISHISHYGENYYKL
jgi:hypothetical protein